MRGPEVKKKYEIEETTENDFSDQTDGDKLRNRNLKPQLQRHDSRDTRNKQQAAVDPKKRYFIIQIYHQQWGVLGKSDFYYIAIARLFLNNCFRAFLSSVAGLSNKLQSV